MLKEFETREDAIETIENLYGLKEKFVKMVIEDLGFSALSDEGVKLLASYQEQYEESLCERMVG